MQAQRADILAWAEANGVRIAPEDWRLEPDVSGKSKVRTELEKIVEECRADQVQRVVFADFQRAGRRGAATVLMLEELAEWGVDLVFVRTGALDLTTYEGRAWALIYAAMGLLKLEEVSRSTTSGMRAAKSRGAPVGNPPLRWTEANDEQLLRCVRDGMKAEAIAKAQVVTVLRRRKVDENGELVTESGKPATGFLDVPTWPSAQAIRDRLRFLQTRAS